jgi:DNA polymerase eta
VKQGVASNKMLSKLGSGHKKPNGQTVVRHRAIRQFLSGFKFTKIRNLGGKLGEQIAQTFNTESVSDLLLVPVEQFKSKLGDDTGVWVHKSVSLFYCDGSPTFMFLECSRMQHFRIPT